MIENELPKLRPCPFCGGKAKFVKRGGFYSELLKTIDFNIMCEKCNVTVYDTYSIDVRLSEDGTLSCEKDDRLKAINRWNGVKDIETENGTNNGAD